MRETRRNEERVWRKWEKSEKKARRGIEKKECEKKREEKLWLEGGKRSWEKKVRRQSEKEKGGENVRTVKK